jgi:hypothetical protein
MCPYITRELMGLYKGVGIEYWSSRVRVELF